MNILMSKEVGWCSVELQERTVREVSEREIFNSLSEEQLQQHGDKKMLTLQAYNMENDPTWSVYFLHASKELAIHYFMNISSFHPPSLNQSEVKRMVIGQTIGSLRFGNHYDYLNAVWEEFHTRVFNKSASDSFRGGMVTSHGDKASGYWYEWAKHGIDKYRGTLLYLLTYTQLMDRCKTESEQWVIENYPVYLSIMEEVEDLVLQQQKERIYDCYQRSGGIPDKQDS